MSADGFLNRAPSRVGGGASRADPAQAPPGRHALRCCSHFKKKRSTAVLPQHPVYAVQKPERKQYNLFRVQCHGQVFGRASEVALLQGRKCGDGFLAGGHCPRGATTGRAHPRKSFLWIHQNKTTKECYIHHSIFSVETCPERVLGTLPIEVSYTLTVWAPNPKLPSRTMIKCW